MGINHKKNYCAYYLWAYIVVDVEPDTEYIAKAQCIPQVFDNLWEESSVHL